MLQCVVVSCWETQTCFLFFSSTFWATKSAQYFFMPFPVHLRNTALCPQLQLPVRHVSKQSFRHNRCLRGISISTIAFLFSCGLDAFSVRLLWPLLCLQPTEVSLFLLIGLHREQQLLSLDTYNKLASTLDYSPGTHSPRWPCRVRFTARSMKIQLFKV